MTNQFSSFVQRAQGKLRPLFIGFLALLFMIPLNIVEGIVRERTGYQYEAINSIGTSWAQNQTIVGPILVVPYTETETVENFDTQNNKVIVTHRKVARNRIIVPQGIASDVTLKTELRERGLYKIPVYIAHVSMKGGFNGYTDSIKELREKQVVLGEPYISVGITDIRGISGIVDVKLQQGPNPEPYLIEPGSKFAGIGNGIHIPVGDAQLDQPFLFDIGFDLKGLNEFHVVPVGEMVEMKTTSNWPHPSFNGQFLPDTREVTADGFTARWKTGLLATNILESLQICLARAECQAVFSKSSGVALYQPVDIYKQSIRAVKYGMLFVIITFAIFFITEALKRTRVSLPQFLLVGGALAMFFLLLVSLAEHIGFGLAYLTAAAATVLLLSYYVSFVLKGRKQGLQTGGILAILYGVLYVILLSEDYALLMGSALLFLLLAVTMIKTRHIDWDNLGQLMDGTPEDKER